MQVGSGPPQSARSRKLQARLAAAIDQTGPLTFAEFMSRALYEPGLGYYSSEHRPWGQAGDYITAPQVHPALGQCVARLAGELDAALESPDPFDLMEVGGGDGSLATATLGTISSRRPALWARTRFTGVERGPHSMTHDAAAAPPLGRATFTSLRAAAEGTVERCGLVVANELFDAFPVHRVRRSSSGLQECYVDRQGDSLVERWDDPSTPALAAYLEAGSIEFEPGQVGEVCLGVAPWFARLDDCMARGALLVIDYGHPTDTLYGPGRRLGTLVAQRRFELSDDLLATPGDQDLTSHVDFGNLRRVAASRGWQFAGECSLRVLLLGLGAAAEMPELPVKQRLALRHLLVSEIAEAHRALWFTRGLAPCSVPFGRERLD